MVLLFLIGGILLLASFDAKAALRDKKQWPFLAAGLLGLLLLAKGKMLLGVALVTAVVLWRQWPRWQKRLMPAVAAGRLNRAEASDLLGVAPDADRDTVLAAHRRLIARNHPDNGGTKGLAARLNAARDVLLQQDRH
jgi:hypothetical protein